MGGGSGGALLCPPNLRRLAVDILKLDPKPGLLSTRPGRNAFHWVHVDDICAPPPPQHQTWWVCLSLVPSRIRFPSFKLSDWIPRYVFKNTTKDGSG